MCAGESVRPVRAGCVSVTRALAVSIFHSRYRVISPVTLTGERLNSHWCEGDRMGTALSSFVFTIDDRLRKVKGHLEEHIEDGVRVRRVSANRHYAASAVMIKALPEYDPTE